MPKKITPKNPEATASAAKKDDKAADRKSGAYRSGRRKMGRKSGAARGNG